MQLIYPGKTKRCLPNIQFSRIFQITCMENRWSNQTKAIEYFQTFIFPYLGKIKVQKGYPKEQMSLVIMDTFKGQDNDDMRKFCAKNSCEIVIIPHNLTNKFQPLDRSVNKTPKYFISDIYNSWLANEVLKQLRAGKAAADVQVSLKLSVIKPLHAKWIADLCNTLKDDKEMAINGFRNAVITEAIENAKDIVEKVENPFKEV